MADYRQQAEQEYNPVYNAKLQALKNQLASNQQAVSQQAGGINSSYDDYVNKQNLQNMRNKNNISNSALGRGLSRSSIVTSNLGEADQINTRQVGYINKERTVKLNDLEQQKRLLAENYNNTVASMEGDRQNAILALARQLEDRAFDKDYKNKTLSMQERAQQAEQAYRQAALAIQKQEMASRAALQREQLAMQKGQQDEADRMKLLEVMSQIGGIYGNEDLSYDQKKSGLGLYEKAFAGSNKYKSAYDLAKDYGVEIMRPNPVNWDEYNANYKPSTGSGVYDSIGNFGVNKIYAEKMLGKNNPLVFPTLISKLLGR